ncbi:MAG: hypothetical protein ACJ765_04385 [Chloroflexota bacterium]
MPHQVLKMTVKGSKGDLAKITAALKAVTGPNGQKVNILAIGGGESAKVNNIELGVITMVLEPDEPPMDGLILNAVRNVDLGNGRRVEHVDTFPNVHVELEDVPGSLSGALEALPATLNIVSVLSMGSVLGTAHVGLAFESAADESTARTALANAGVVIHP